MSSLYDHAASAFLSAEPPVWYEGESDGIHVTQSAALIVHVTLYLCHYAFVRTHLL